MAVFVTRGNAAAVAEPNGETRDCQAIADETADAFTSEECPAVDDEDAETEEVEPAGESGSPKS
ncbi:MAG: hypothetical protein LC634_03500 [Sphingomonadales bacterium]|nr:hypothetical protein [Sphingomonadales bacterium]